MEIQYYGANCVRLSNKKISLVVDDNLEELGLKSITNSSDIAMFTKTSELPKKDAFTINSPGEYEISEVSIRGIAARSHIDESGFGSTIYSVRVGDLNIGLIGHIKADLSDEQIESLGVVDILVIPVGGYGYTLEADEAVSVVKKIEPNIIVPTHYAQDGIKYPVPQADLQSFLKAIGVSEPDYKDSLTIKDGEAGDKLRVVILKPLASS